VTLPAKPVINTTAGMVAKVPGTDRTQYATFLRWRDRDLQDRFSAKVIELIRQRYPEAFDAEGGEP
jgi:hypothetical protein